LTPSQPQQLAPLDAAAAADTTNATTIHNSLSQNTTPLRFYHQLQFFSKIARVCFAHPTDHKVRTQCCYGIFLDILRLASDLMFLDTSSCTAYSVVAVSVFEVKCSLRHQFFGQINLTNSIKSTKVCSDFVTYDSRICRIATKSGHTCQICHKFDAFFDR